MSGMAGAGSSPAAFVVARDDNHFDERPDSVHQTPTPEVILGSDILKFTPANIMSHTYCLDENNWNEVIEPVRPSTYIGPYADCNSKNEQASAAPLHTEHFGY